MALILEIEDAEREKGWQTILGEIAILRRALMATRQMVSFWAPTQYIILYTFILTRSRAFDNDDGEEGGEIRITGFPIGLFDYGGRSSVYIPFE